MTTRIQALFRGFVVRRKVGKILATYKGYKSVVKIQSHIRRLFAMRQADRLRFQRLYMFSARLIQTSIRSYLSQKTLRMLDLIERYADKVVILQKNWRMYIAFKRFTTLKQGLRLVVLRVKTMWNEAGKGVRKIQAVYRGHLWRLVNPEIVLYLQKQKELIQRHFYFHREARRIQSVWRGHFARNRFRELRLDMVIVQSYLRMRLWRNWFLSMRSSAHIVQKHWRTWWLKQSERMAEESLRRTPISYDSPTLYGKFLLFGIHTPKNENYINLVKESLQRISEVSTPFTPFQVVIGGDQLLALVEDKGKHRANHIESNPQNRLYYEEPQRQPQGESQRESKEGDKGKHVQEPLFYKEPENVSKQFYPENHSVLQFGPGWINWSALKFPGIATGPIVQIACGNAHCLARSKEGKVFSRLCLKLFS